MAIMAALGSIFLAYHRTDDPDTVQIIGHISDRLAKHFGDDAIVDGNTIAQPGTGLAQTIEALLPSQSVVLVPIGPHWLDPVPPTGQRSVDNPYDPVRLQIEAALRHHIPIIPLLVGRAAALPAPGSLPPSLTAILTLPSLSVREEPDFTADTSDLTTTLGRWVRPRPVTTTTVGSRSARHFGLIYGFILMPADVLVVVLATAAANALSVNTNTGGSGATSSSTILANVTLVVLLVLPLIAYFLAGWFAARRTGLTRTGTFAGLIAACVTGGTGALLATVVVILGALNYNPAPTGGFGGALGRAIGLALTLAAAVIGVLWLGVNLGIGAAFGAIGGAFGRRAYHGLATAKAPTPAAARGSTR